MNEEKKEKIWIEIQNAIKESRGMPLPEERSVRDLMALWEMTENQARATIKELVNNNILLKRRIGSSKVAYYRPNPEIDNFDNEIKKVLIK